MLGPLRISIVIPTFNRKTRLQRVLSALARQTVAPNLFEVVVIDDGSSDGTFESLQTHTFPFAVRPFRQQNGGPASARNRGIQEARGELVLFLDDDVEPVPELLAEHLSSHDREPIPLVVLGTLSSLPHYEQPWVTWEQEKVEEQYDAMLRGLYQPTFRQFWTGNASVGRDHLLALKGFNPAYPRGEDVELGYRLHARGLQFRFNPRAKGLHHAERSLDSWSHAHRSYGRLEVEIFGNLERDGLVDTLAGNFGRMHPGTRWLVRSCLDRPQLASVAERALKRWLTSEMAKQTPALSNKVCGALANLLYWQESAKALGSERITQVLRLAAQRPPQP